MSFVIVLHLGFNERRTSYFYWFCLSKMARRLQFLCDLLSTWSLKSSDSWQSLTYLDFVVSSDTCVSSSNLRAHAINCHNSSTQSVGTLFNIMYSPVSIGSFIRLGAGSYLKFILGTEMTLWPIFLHLNNPLFLELSMALASSCLVYQSFA